MSQSLNLPDDEFLAAFMACRLNGAAFDHRGHLRVAWLLLRRYPLEQAIEQVCSGIARLATHLGAPDKFNRTLSEALVRLMAHDGSHATTFEQFLSANAELLTDAGGLIARHYSPDRLGSAAAKASFVFPDRLPLPPCRA